MEGSWANLPHAKLEFFAPTFQYHTIKDCSTITCMILLLPSGRCVAPSCVPAVTNQIRIAVDSPQICSHQPGRSRQVLAGTQRWVQTKAVN